MTANWERFISAEVKQADRAKREAHLSLRNTRGGHTDETAQVVSGPMATVGTRARTGSRSGRSSVA